MELQVWLAYFAAAWVIAISPGSGAVLSMTHGLAYGVRGASATILGLELGVWHHDTSVAGLGGCPYAKGATGNVATEDVVFLLHGMGIETGIDLDALVDAGQYISEQLGRVSNSRVARALLAKRNG